MPIKTTWLVEHSCGHGQDHDLGDKRPSERAGYARWLARNECSECWRADRDRQHTKDREAWLAEVRAKQAAEIDAWERRAAMPALDGSERAVEWGRRVRHQLLCGSHELAIDAGRSEGEFASAVEDPARKVTAASWWIDQRDTNPADVAEAVGDAAGEPGAPTGTENPF